MFSNCCGAWRVEIVLIRMMKLKVLLKFFAFTLITYVDAQLLILPPISEAILSENSYECSCDFIYDEYDPVCGSNGLTYTNPSYLYCDQKCKDPNLSTYRKGACPVDATKLPTSTNDSWYERVKNVNRCNCPKSVVYNPVCGTNGITYDNPAQLQCERKCRQPQLNIARYGLCREEEYFKDPLPFFTEAIKRCDCIYRNERDLVCATDGYTYPNPSTVSCVTRCNNPSLRIVHYGRCRENQKPHNYGAVKCKCTASSEHYRPICADNGITYDNLSLLNCARECLNRDLKIVSEYPCRDYLNVDERKI